MLERVLELTVVQLQGYLVVVVGIAIMELVKDCKVMVEVGIMDVVAFKPHWLCLVKIE